MLPAPSSTTSNPRHKLEEHQPGAEPPRWLRPYSLSLQPRRFRRHPVGSFPITIAFETKEEGASRRLNLALELLRSHGVEIPEELQDNSRGDISACSPNDDDEDNTKGTYENVPSENAPPAPDNREHLNGVESSSSSGMTDWCTTRSMAAKAASTQPENHDLSTNQGTEHGMDHHGQGQHRTNLEHPIPADDNRLHPATGTR